MRGHSSLPARLDVRIQVRLTNGLPAWTSKGQREGLDTCEHIYRLQPVDLPNSPSGSCIVVPREKLPPAQRMPSGANQKKVLSLIKEIVGAFGYVSESLLMDKLGDAENLGKQRVKEAIEGLIKHEFIRQETSGNWILI